MSLKPSEATEHDAECGQCEIAPDRRRFLGTVAAAIGVLVAQGFVSSAAEAMLPPLVEPIGRSKNSVSYAVPASDGVQIDKSNEVILVRYQGMGYAFALSCPHQNTALRWNEGAGQFQCPKHKSKYRPDGEFISGRATRAMDRFSVRKEGDKIVVDLDALHEEDKDPTGWGSAKVAL